MGNGSRETVIEEVRRRGSGREKRRDEIHEAPQRHEEERRPNL